MEVSERLPKRGGNPCPGNESSTASSCSSPSGTTALVARHFAHTGWPLRNANLWLVGLAAVIFLGAYAAKAWGWQRLCA